MKAGTWIHRFYLCVTVGSCTVYTVHRANLKGKAWPRMPDQSACAAYVEQCAGPDTTGELRGYDRHFNSGQWKVDNRQEMRSTCHSNNRDEATWPQHFSPTSFAPTLNSPEEQAASTDGATGPLRQSGLHQMLCLCIVLSLICWPLPCLVSTAWQSYRGP